MSGLRRLGCDAKSVGSGDRAQVPYVRALGFRVPYVCDRGDLGMTGVE